MHSIDVQDVTKTFVKSRYGSAPTSMKSFFLQELLRTKKKQHPVLRVDALKNISFSVARGEVVGIIGKNGSGKSTLLRLLTGIISPDAGSISVQGRIAALIELGAGFHPELTGRENAMINGVILGMSKKEMLHKMDEIIDFSELGDSIDEPVRTYSSGMYARLGFSVATSVNPDVFMIDEILSVGDLNFAQKCSQRMNRFRDEGKTIVLVTHDTSMVQSWCSQAIWIQDGVLQQVGKASEVVTAYKQAMMPPAASTALSTPDQLGLERLTNYVHARAEVLQKELPALPHVLDVIQTLQAACKHRRKIFVHADATSFFVRDILVQHTLMHPTLHRVFQRSIALMPERLTQDAVAGDVLLVVLGQQPLEDTIALLQRAQELEMITIVITSTSFEIQAIKPSHVLTLPTKQVADTAVLLTAFAHAIIELCCDIEHV